MKTTNQVHPLLFFVSLLFGTINTRAVENPDDTQVNSTSTFAHIPRLIRRADTLFASFGVSILHVAARQNDLRMIKHLVQDLSFNVDCTTRADHGEITSLYIACKNGYTDMVRFLLHAGADGNKQNRIGRTPLHTAAMQGHLHVVRLLARHGTAINSADNDNKTPLSLAIESGKIRVVLWLIQAGAGIRVEDLEPACGNGRFRAITVGALAFLQRRPSTKRLFEIVVERMIEDKKHELAEMIGTERGKRDAALCRLFFPDVVAPAIFVDAGNQTAGLIKEFRTFLMSKRVPTDIANSICFEF